MYLPYVELPIAMPGTTSDASITQEAPGAIPGGGNSNTGIGEVKNAISPMLTTPAVCTRSGSSLKALASAGASAIVKPRVSPLTHPGCEVTVCNDWKVAPLSDEEYKIHAVGDWPYPVSALACTVYRVSLMRSGNASATYGGVLESVEVERLIALAHPRTEEVPGTLSNAPGGIQFSSPDE